MNVKLYLIFLISGYDIEVFDTWLNRLLHWFWVHNVTGDHKDSMRVDFCETTLNGLAATWYADEVEAWNQRTRKWYFGNLICSMYKWFIHEVTGKMRQTVTLELSSRIVRELWRSITNSNAMQAGTTPWRVLDEEEVPQGTSWGSRRESAQVQTCVCRAYLTDNTVAWGQGNGKLVTSFPKL